jgi:glyoxylase-like metal-dependent hydrolase (beta-lactamase superfamily II)
MSRAASRTRPDVREHPGPSAITPSIWWVGRGSWGVLPILTRDGDCNIFLLKGEEFDVLIDTGFGAALGSLERNIRRAGSEPGRVREIWLTHSHLDHFVGAGRWTARYPETVCRISHLSIQFLEQRNYRLIGSFHPARPRGFRLPRRLEPLREGDRLRCPPFEFGVEELPGHVPDHLGFRGEVDGLQVLFSGDAAIGDQNNIPGMIGWIDGYWLSSLPVYEKTLERLEANPPDLLLPGHGRPHSGASVRRSLRNCLRRVQRLLASPDVQHLGPYL